MLVSSHCSFRHEKRLSWLLNKSLVLRKRSLRKTASIAYAAYGKKYARQRYKKIQNVFYIFLQFAVIAFSTATQVLGPKPNEVNSCYAYTLARAIPKNRETIYAQIDKLEAKGSFTDLVLVGYFVFIFLISV